MPRVRIFYSGKEKIVPFCKGDNLLEILKNNDIKIRSDCGGRGACGQCLVKLTDFNFDPENLNLPVGDSILACRTFPEKDVGVIVDNFFKDAKWELIETDLQTTDSGRIPDKPVASINSSTETAVVIDLGTTLIRLGAFNPFSGIYIGGVKGLNSQQAYGADIMTRLVYATASPEKASLLQNVLIKAIVAAFSKLAEVFEINTRKISQVKIVGNTAMLTLFCCKKYELLLNPDYWGAEIELPISDGFIEKCRENWKLSSSTLMNIEPPLGGFVGSDLLASVRAAEILDAPRGTLLIDFGTNSEIALWDKEQLWVTSASGGPAFEGSGLSCGKAAEAGAIYRVEESLSGLQIKTLGEAFPTGICGSGLVDLIACLLNQKVINAAGRFKNSEHRCGYQFCKDNPGLSIKGRDIDLFQRAKAAISAGAVSLMRQAGIDKNELQKVIVCGSFGKYLCPSNAIMTGLLPKIPESCIELVNCASLVGAAKVGTNENGSQNFNVLRKKCRLINMSQLPSYEDIFIQNLRLEALDW